MSSHCFLKNPVHFRIRHLCQGQFTLTWRRSDRKYARGNIFLIYSDLFHNSKTSIVGFWKYVSAHSLKNKWWQMAGLPCRGRVHVLFLMVSVGPAELVRRPSAIYVILHPWRVIAECWWSILRFFCGQWGHFGAKVTGRSHVGGTGETGRGLVQAWVVGLIQRVQRVRLGGHAGTAWWGRALRGVPWLSAG